MKIKNWKWFKEAISGTFDIMPFGPNSPRQELRNTISSKDTTVIEGSDGVIYDLYKFEDLYNLYLKTGGKELLSDFTKENIDKLIHYLK
jgi:hypothetical protein